MLTYERVREAFDYDPETGHLTWAIATGGWRRPAGKRAGCYDGRRRLVRIDDKLVSEHRIIWLWMTGEIPDLIDHINRDGADNRWANLRIADKVGNGINSDRQKHGLPRGVSRKRNKYQARLWLGDGKSQSLGVYDDPKIAGAVWRLAARERHGEFLPD